MCRALELRERAADTRGRSCPGGGGSSVGGRDPWWTGGAGQRSYSDSACRRGEPGQFRTLRSRGVTGEASGPLDGGVVEQGSHCVRYVLENELFFHLALIF